MTPLLQMSTVLLSVRGEGNIPQYGASDVDLKRKLVVVEDSKYVDIGTQEILPLSI